MSLGSILKNNYRTIGLIIFFILVGIGIGLEITKWRKTSTVVQVNNPLLLKQVDSFRDVNDKLYIQLEQRVYTKEQVSNMIDSLSKALKVKTSTVQAVEKIVLRVDTIYRYLPTMPIYVYKGKDTAYQISLHDGWNDITAVAGKDTGSISFNSRDTLTRVEVVKSPLFGTPQHLIYINNTNPYVKINEGASFSIQEKKPWLIIGPFVGWDPFTSRATIGIGAVYPIFSLKR